MDEFISVSFIHLTFYSVCSKIHVAVKSATLLLAKTDLSELFNLTSLDRPISNTKSIGLVFIITTFCSFYM